MRFGDLLSLPLEALWQQKSRTVLTTLGVVFGSFVLAASLAIGHGVQETINNITRRSDLLRTIAVSTRWQPRESKVDETKVEGEMSEAKRKRIRRALVEHDTDSQGRAEKLSRKRLQELSAMEHVAAAVPIVHQNGYAVFEGHEVNSAISAARPDDEACKKRLVAGRMFNSADERAIVVSEYVLYQCGLRGDEEVAATVGKKLRLEFRRQFSQPGLLVHMVKPRDAAVTRDERAALDTLTKNLPDNLEKLGLTAEQASLVNKSIGQEKPKDLVFGIELPIVGVVRMGTEEDRKPLWDPLAVGGDCILPLETAMNLADDIFGPTNWDMGQVIVLVDDENYTRDVYDRIKATGLHTFAPLEEVDRERLTYTLVFGGMTCVAAVAMLVSAMGIANTMLMSVLERTREIGIMKAVGAGPWHLLSVFLIEGALIGAVGGVVGLLAAWGASYPGNAWVHSMVDSKFPIKVEDDLFVFPAWLSVTVLAFALIVTTLAAVYPARRAANIDPVAALRHE